MFNSVSFIEANGKDFPSKTVLRYCHTVWLVATVVSFRTYGFESGSGCVMMIGQFSLMAEVTCTHIFINIMKCWPECGNGKWRLTLAFKLYDQENRWRITVSWYEPLVICALKVC